MRTKTDKKENAVVTPSTEQEGVSYTFKAEPSGGRKKFVVKETICSTLPTTDTRRKPSKGTFVKQKNADTDREFFTSFYKYTDGYNINLAYNGIYQTKEEILEKGSLLQKLRLYFHTAELRSFYGTEGDYLTKEEIADIMKSTTETKETIETAKVCAMEYKTIRKYGEDVLRAYKNYQVQFCILAKFLNKLSYYEQKADDYTRIMQMTNFKKLPEEQLKKQILELVIAKKNEGVSYTFDLTEDKFFLVLSKKEGGIYSTIRKAAKDCKSVLSSFKAKAKVAEEYIKNSTLKYYPIIIQQSIMDAERELFERDLVEDITFFRSYINDRREQGETITPEEEERAVVPDYLEVKPKKEVYDNCKYGIKLIEAGKI